MYWNCNGRARNQTSDSPISHLVAEVEPLLLHEDLESLLSPVVRVQQELGQSQQLRGPVPPVATVNYHGTSLRL